MARHPRVDDTQLALIEKMLRISFTAEERMLLTTRKDLLAPLEQQDSFVLRQSLTPLSCPGCGGITCQRGAAPAGVTVRDHVPDDAYRCPRCEAHLTWNLAVAGHQYFTLTPEG